MRKLISTCLVVSILTPSLLCAQVQERDRWEQRSSGVRYNRAAWTAVGAGGGFALGAYLGFRWFDDATYSDRKIWTTAILSTIAGGVAGFLVGQARRQRAHR